MNAELIQIVLLAAVAGFFLYRLYDVLGRRVGRQPGEAADQPLPQRPAAPVLAPAPEIPGLAALKAREPEFDPARFLEGARLAYETIVRAFSEGDRDSLRPLLSPHVFDSFAAAIETSLAQGRSQAVEFLHAPRADLERLETDGDLARARVRFLAEIRTRSKGPEGEAVDDRRTAETWTFERRIADLNPNWILARVEAAEA